MENQIENKIEQTENGIKSTIKDGKIESTVEQYIDEKGLTHFAFEVKKKKGNKIIIERKEYVL